MNEQGHICFASNTTIGRKIREARRKMNMTQAELKDKLAAYGVQIQTPRITKWELGGNMPSVYQLFALCYGCIQKAYMVDQLVYGISWGGRTLKRSIHQGEI